MKDLLPYPVTGLFIANLYDISLLSSLSTGRVEGGGALIVYNVKSG